MLTVETLNKDYDEQKVCTAIGAALTEFYTSLTGKLDKIKIDQILKRKNPYLYRAKGISSASQILEDILSAFISSSEETLFGNCFFEPIALVVAGGQKAVTEGVDITVDRDNTLYSIAVKSGTSVFNADSRTVHVPLPEGTWNITIRDDIAGTNILAQAEGTVDVAAFTTMALVQKKPVDVVAALIWEKDKFLICQRPATKARGLLWEFVGGKAEPGETLQQALMRECAEELAINVEVGEQFMAVVHQYPDILIRLTLFHCTIPSGYPQALEHTALEWIHPSQIDNFEFCPADADILEEIKRIYEKRKPL